MSASDREERQVRYTRRRRVDDGHAGNERRVKTPSSSSRGNQMKRNSSCNDAQGSSGSRLAPRSRSMRSRNRKTMSPVGSERLSSRRNFTDLHERSYPQVRVRSSRKTPVFARQDRLRMRVIIGVGIVLILIALVGLSKCASRCSSHQVESVSAEQASQAPQAAVQPLRYATAYTVIDTQTYDYDRARAGGSPDPERELREILEHVTQYPASLIDNMSLNPEMLHFVYDYPSRSHEASPDTIGEVLKVSNKIPLILQFDERWGYQPYGEDHLLAVSGCGPTCISMVASGLTGDKTVTPLKVATYAEKHNLYSAGSGTSWELMSSGCEAFGISGKQMKSVTRAKVISELEKGHPIIASMAPGDFTILGHYIILTGVTQDGNLEINDPNSQVKSASVWPIDRVLSQVKTAWVMKKK